MTTFAHFALAALCSAALILSPVAAAQAAKQDHDHDHDHDHQHDTLGQRKHVHGAITFNIALEGETLAVELDVPADNVVGFEKSPRNDAERKAIADANAWLASGRNIAAVPRNAGCRLLSVDFAPPKFGSGHADYRARFAYRCPNPAALDWVELPALSRLLEIDKVEVNVITASVQRQTELAAGSTRVSLK
jgi:hypothetical protein